MSGNFTNPLKWFTRIAVTVGLAVVVLVLPGITDSKATSTAGSLSIQLPHAGSLHSSCLVLFRGVPVGKVVSVTLLEVGGSHLAQAQAAVPAMPVLQWRLVKP